MLSGGGQCVDECRGDAVEGSGKSGAEEGVDNEGDGACEEHGVGGQDLEAHGEGDVSLDGGVSAGFRGGVGGEFGEGHVAMGVAEEAGECPAVATVVAGAGEDEDLAAAVTEQASGEHGGGAGGVLHEQEGGHAVAGAGKVVEVAGLLAAEVGHGGC